MPRVEHLHCSFHPIREGLINPDGQPIYDDKGIDGLPPLFLDEVLIFARPFEIFKEYLDRWGRHDG